MISTSRAFLLIVSVALSPGRQRNGTAGDRLTVGSAEPFLGGFAVADGMLTAFSTSSVAAGLLTTDPASAERLGGRLEEELEG